MRGKINCNIKPETLERVLRLVASSHNTTRKIISEKLGISLVTAGKAVDYFISEGLFGERRLHKTNPGPRPMVINLYSKYNCLTLDLCRRDYSAELLDLNGRKLKSVQYRYNNNIFIDDNFVRFLREIETSVAKSHPEYCIGIGVLIPENYVMSPDIDASPEFRENYLKQISEILDKRLSPHRLIFGTKEKSALDCFSSLPDYSNNSTLVYLCLNDKSVISDVMIDGKRVTGRDGRGYDITRGFGTNKLDIGYLLKHSHSADDYCKTVAFALANTIAYFDPDNIVIDSETYRFTDGMTEIIREELIGSYGFSDDTLPRFITRKKNEPTYFARGMMVNLKEKFIDDVVSKMFG